LLFILPHYSLLYQLPLQVYFYTISISDSLAYSLRIDLIQQYIEIRCLLNLVHIYTVPNEDESLVITKTSKVYHEVLSILFYTTTLNLCDQISYIYQLIEGIITEVVHVNTLVHYY
jgi:hypothetical protein